MLVLGIMLVLFVVGAPKGIIGCYGRAIVCAREAHDYTAAPDAPLLQVGTLTKTFGGFTALDNISVDIRKGERFGLIGPNGSGQDHADQLHFRRAASADRQRGVLRRGHHPTAAALARAPWHRPQLPDSAAVQEHDGAGKPHGRARLCHVGSSLPEEDVAMSILTRMGLAAKAGAPTDTLSQVELRKMELARALAVRPKLLISDEAMAGLSSSEVDEVLDLLISLGEEDITIIMIEHIMQAVMRFGG